MFVYSAKNKISETRYIGITVKSLQERQAQHHYNAFVAKKKNYFYRAIRKYGWDNFIWEIIDTALSHEELLIKEKNYIAQFNTYLGDGYNETSGGRGTVGWKHSEETKKKIGESSKISLTGIKRSKETRDKIGKRCKDKTYEELYGIDKALILKEKQSNSQKENYENNKNRIKALSKTYEEKFGIEKSEQIKKKMSLSRKLKLNNGKRSDLTDLSRLKMKEAKKIIIPNELRTSIIEEFQKKNKITNDMIKKFGYSRYILQIFLKEVNLWQTSNSV